MQSADVVPSQRTQPRGGSRRGCPNKLTATIKDDVLKSFDAVGRWQYLVQQAKENPKAYLHLLSRLVPQEVVGAMGADGVTVIVQSLHIEPSPTPGVLAHPDARFIAPPVGRVLDVIEDAQP